MLVLARKVNERIVLGNGITLTVVKIKDGYVKLGIEAPQDVVVLREELVPQMDGTRRRASCTLPSTKSKTKGKSGPGSR